MEGGIVPGGGVALRDVQKTLSGEGIVVAVADALIANEKTLVANSGYEVKNLADLPAGGFLLMLYNQIKYTKTLPKQNLAVKLNSKEI